ncbi:MAG: hypothetical protein JWP97_6635 [Labilithrix sp.]|nr:hypothetical protein [Labilithrix sp.]
MTTPIGSVTTAGDYFGELKVDRDSGLTANQTSADGAGFASVLKGAVEAASVQENNAVQKAEALANGKTDDLHGTMIAMKEADISLKLVGNVRNKLLDAFHELWRTSV